MTSRVIYQGQLRTQATHEKSGLQLITDAPTDNNGKGEAFSPTDMVATALASCMLTVMGIKADKMGVNMDHSSAEITKVMASDPRRIAEVHIQIRLLLDDESDKTKKILEQTGLTCPVAKSLSSNLVQNISFVYGKND